MAKTTKSCLRRVVSPLGVVEEFGEWICELSEDNSVGSEEAEQLINEKIEVTVELYTQEFNRILRVKLENIKKAWLEED